MTTQPKSTPADEIAKHLPFLRRYARALCGTQDSGDAYAVATLEAILAAPERFEADGGNKVALFAAFHAIWTTSGATVEVPTGPEGLENKAQAHLQCLTTNTREALLLHTIEGFQPHEISKIMALPQTDVTGLIEIAYQEMAKSTSGRIMIIEDEAIISMDLEAIVAQMGHRVTGVARSADAALALAEQEKPDLILSDIKLVDGSSGIDAVNGILTGRFDGPVIFITAFPEELLTGDGPEPAFLISKPYTEAQIRSAVSQAMFFSSTETLLA
ncbi:response regulator [Phaeobacter sp.]|uniref:response regulator n=1 Tax=Phaeobacter sp. TaxID=1902409 RepID=UPI0025CFF68E|nr:response regulator [Phaeobacter sp.]